ncbi:MAG TPA: MoaD/ThiS family protein [Desulfomonilaceae bacterium]|nr:MoaD/ThiS family protein [Desulfomonilaceae bacterium]
MKVQIHLYATLASYLPDSGAEANSIEASDGSSIGTVLNRLGIPPDAPKIILLNGVHADLQTILKDGDKLAVFPPIAGG